MLPGLKSRVLPEYIRKTIHINGKHGKRLMNDEPCTHLSQQLFIDLMYDLICEAANADVVLVHGGPIRRALKERLGM
jgi:hypothetical protein